MSANGPKRRQSMSAVMSESWGITEVVVLTVSFVDPDPKLSCRVAEPPAAKIGLRSQVRPILAQFRQRCKVSPQRVKL